MHSPCVERYSAVVPVPNSYTYPRYLKAKRSVDERALNQRVWTRFVRLASRRESPLRILEVGGGVGATLERIVETLDGREVEPIEYTLVDVKADNIDAARERVSSLTTEQNWEEAFRQVSVRFETIDLFDFAANEEGGRYDVIVGQAIFDLLCVPKALRALRPLLVEDGLWYLPIHFDGVTAFEPPIDSTLDAQIGRLYHESMANDEPEGHDGAHTGRRLLTRLRKEGANLLEAGSSDWVVFAEKDGYPEDEAYFLHHVLHFVEEELAGRSALDSGAFAEWVQERRRQIEAGELIYVAHQLDVLALQPGRRR